MNRYVGAIRSASQRTNCCAAARKGLRAKIGSEVIGHSYSTIKRCSSGAGEREEQRETTGSDIF